MIPRRNNVLFLLFAMTVMATAAVDSARAERGVHERSHQSVMAAFRGVVSTARESTVMIFSGGKPIALGAIVRSDGHILTKASELHGELDCLLSNSRRSKPEVVGVHKKHDLALLKIDAKGLKAITWSDGNTAVGSWLATTGLTADPVAIGVASVGPRAIRPESGWLGIQFDPLEIGSRVKLVFPNSSAQKAGLRVNDIIRRANGQTIQTVVTEVDGMEVRSRVTLGQIIHAFQPGEKVELLIVRDEEEIQVTATLGWSSSVAPANSHANMEFTLGGPLSQRRAGFSQVLQHDTVLRPRDCGGPIVNLSGEAVGLNIARSGRTSSFAIPASLVQSVLGDLLSGSLPPPPNFLDK